MKFKIGDSVKVKRNSKYHKGAYASAVGIVKDIERYPRWPYEVWFANKDTRHFHANELELIGGDK